jgi:hypothetical protein
MPSGHTRQRWWGAEASAPPPTLNQKWNLVGQLAAAPSGVWDRVRCLLLVHVSAGFELRTVVASVAERALPVDLEAGWPPHVRH